MYQDIDISDYAAAITAGKQRFRFSGYIFGDDDQGRIIVEYHDASKKVLGSYDTGKVVGETWKLQEKDLLPPTNTVVLRVRLTSIKVGGRRNGTGFDDLKLVAISP